MDTFILGLIIGASIPLLLCVGFGVVMLMLIKDDVTFL